MPIPTVTVPPAPPTTSDPDNFDARADAFLPALVTFAEDLNATAAAINVTAGEVDADAAAASASEIAASASAATATAAATTAVNAPGTSATSTTSLAVGTGSKSLTIQTGKAFAIGQFVTITSTASPANWMHGNITAHNSGTGALTVNVGTTAGSGTIASWTVALSGPSAAGTSLPLAGGTMTGKVTLAASASGGAGINAPPGADPSAPVNGDIWTTATAVKARLNGTTSTLAFTSDLAAYQPLDATLTALAGVTTAANKLVYATGADAFATTDLTAFARQLLDDTDAATMRSTLGLAIGTAVQAYDADLAAIAALATQSFGRSLLTMANANALLGQIITAGSITFPNGYIKLANNLHIMWGSFTAAANSSTSFNYSTIDGAISLSSGSIAIVSGGLSGEYQDNAARTTSCSTSGFTVWSSENSSTTIFFIAVGA